MLVDEFEQFFVHGGGLFFFAAPQGLGGTMIQMIFHQVAGNAAQSFLHGSDLRDDVRTIAVFFDHFLEATHLPFDATKALAIGGFQPGIDADGLASLATSLASAIGNVATAGGALNAGNDLSCRVIHNTPYPYVYPTPLLVVKPPESRSGLLVCEGCYNAGMTLVEITYELHSPLSQDQLRSLGEFANTYGLRRFRVDEAKNQLSFEYDASRLRETQVAHVLGQARIAVTRKVN